MKLFQLVLTLVMLVLEGSNAVTSCIQCESLPGKENSTCVTGTGKGVANLHFYILSPISRDAMQRRGGGVLRKCDLGQC